MTHDIQWWIALLWPVFTALVNALTRLKSDDEWLAFQTAHPWLAVVKVIWSAVGTDVHDAVENAAKLQGKP